MTVESVRPDRSPAEPTEREWLEGLREEDRAASAVSEPESTGAHGYCPACDNGLACPGAQSTQTVDVRDMRVKAFAQIEVDVDVVFCDDRDVLFSADIADAVAKHLGPGVVVHDVDEWEAISAVSEGPAEASVADSANTTETRGKDGNDE